MPGCMGTAAGAGGPLDKSQCTCTRAPKRTAVERLAARIDRLEARLAEMTADAAP